MNKLYQELLNKDGCDRLQDWVAVGPIQRANLENFADYLIDACVAECQRIAEQRFDQMYGRSESDGALVCASYLKRMKD